MSAHNRSRFWLLGLAIALAPVGCGPPEVDTTYGRSRGASINGTGAFFELLKQGGHEVRTAIRANDTLAEWANVVVRFDGQPGPPDKKEGKWLLDWLNDSPRRKVVYVPRDFDTEAEFWDAVLAAQPKDAKVDDRKLTERRRDKARSWVSKLPPKAKEPSNADDWFAVAVRHATPEPCKALEGPWAEGVDAKAAAVVVHENLKADHDETVLLSGDGKPLAMAWTLYNESQILVVANSSFLLNGALLNRARRPLAMRVVEWIGEGPLHVASLEGRGILAEAPPGAASPFQLIKVPPFDWISAHLLTFLSLLALSFAVRLGRPRPEPPSGVERPSAHPEALGVLLARSGRSDAARMLLESYRRWRHPSHVAGRSAPAHNPPR